MPALVSHDFAPSLDFKVLEHCCKHGRLLSSAGTHGAAHDKPFEALTHLDGLQKWKEYDKEIESFVTLEEWQRVDPETNQGRVTLRFADFSADYRLPCLCNLWKRQGKTMITQAYEKALTVLGNHWYSKSRASIYVSVGGSTEGVTFGEDIFLSAPHMLSVSKPEIVGVVAHELVHAGLGFDSSSTVHREKLLCFRMLLEHNKSVAPGIRSQGARIRSHGRVERYATDSGRKGYPRCTEDCVTDAFGLGVQQKAFSAVLKLHFGQIVQIKLDVSPLARERFPLKTLLQSPA